MILRMPQIQAREHGEKDSSGNSDWYGTRSVTPAQTLARVSPLLPEMGITRVANVTGLDRIGIPVVMVTRPTARSLAVSQGKGLSLEAAKVSGIMEAVELYHAETIQNPLKLGNARELSGNHDLVEIDRLAKVADCRFHPDLVMLWIEGKEISGGHCRWLPFECVRANFTVPPPPGSGCFDCSSNGLASGNTMEEAICQGLCEVIERDSTALWNQSEKSERQDRKIDPSTIEVESCRQIIGRFESAGLSIGIWETTTDIGVPSFFCLVLDRDDPTSHGGIGASAHPDNSQALMRALLEAAQVRMTYITGVRDDLAPMEYNDAFLRKRHLFFRRMLDRPGKIRTFEINEQSCTTDSCIAFILDRLRLAGLSEPIAVNLSKPEFDLPVVRVVVPGLEGPDDHDGYVPGLRARAGSG